MNQTKTDRPKPTRKTKNKNVSFDKVIREIARERKTNKRKEQEKKRKEKQEARKAAQREKEAIASKKASEDLVNLSMEDSDDLETSSDENDYLDVEYIPGKIPSCCAEGKELRDIAKSV